MVESKTIDCVGGVLTSLVLGSLFVYKGFNPSAVWYDSISQPVYGTEGLQSAVCFGLAAVCVGAVAKCLYDLVKK